MWSDTKEWNEVKRWHLEKKIERTLTALKKNGFDVMYIPKRARCQWTIRKQCS